jgi:hypothetical protein
MALLRVLTSPIGVNQQGQHNADNIKQNVRDRMRAILASNDLSEVDQQAMLDIRDDRDTKFVFVTLDVTPVPVRIIAPDGAEGTLVVMENNVDPIDEHDAAEATAGKPPWVVDLSPTKLYSVRHTRGDASSSDAPINWSVLAATSKDGEYVFVLPDA